LSGITGAPVRVYVDSDILIWHLRGDRRAAELLRRLSQDESADLWTGALQRAEIVLFARECELPETLALLLRFKTHPVTQEIVDEAGPLYRKWRPTHGIDVNDAILAATAMLTGGKIYTLNLKHYPMPDLVVLRGW